MNESWKYAYKLLLVAMLVLRASAGGMRQIWELRFSDIPASRITEPAAWVSAVSFSPDGRSVAATVREEQERKRQAVSLVLADVADPRVGVRSFTVEGPVFADGMELGPAMSWSPTGEAVALPTIVQIHTGAECSGDKGRAAFYDSRKMAVGAFSFPTFALHFFDMDCQPLGAWELEGKWDLSDGSPYTHLLALSKSVPKRAQIMVVDPIRKSISHLWQLQGAWASWALFADDGRAVCALDGTAKSGVARCWDVGSGKEIGRTRSGNPHWPMKTALHARRAILSCYGWGVDFERLGTAVSALKKQAVWDFGTGEEIASWEPRYQSYDSGAAKDEIKEPYVFAISPDGQSVVQAGSGTLRLYKLDR